MAVSLRRYIEEHWNKAAALFFVAVLPLLFVFFTGLWARVSTFYIYIANGMIWFSLILLFISLMKKKEHEKFNEEEMFTVVLPVYNEKPESLIRTVEGIINTKGQKEIFIVDDGSINNIWSTIQMLRAKYPFNIAYTHRFFQNQGKREALAHMIERVRTRFVVATDSAGELKDDAMLYLLKPLEDKSIGLVGGQPVVKNEFKSLLNRFQAALWWCASNKSREALSGFGVMGAVSGNIMAFRRDDFLKVKDEFLGQRFFGKKVVSGDDGMLTSLLMRNGLKIKYVDAAINYARPKKSFRLFLKQQLRWRKNIIRRSIWVLKNINIKRGPVYFVYIIGHFMLPFMFISIMTAFMLSLIWDLTITPLFDLISVVIIVTFLQDLIMVFNRKERLKTIIPYAVFNLFFVMPLWIIALFTLEDMGWGTR